MSDPLDQALALLAETPLRPPEPVAELRRRGRGRRARRRGLAALAGVVVLGVVASTVGALRDRDDRRSLRVSSQATTTVPAALSAPSGRFAPTYLPAGLVMLSEAEMGLPPFSPGPGRYRTWTGPASSGPASTLTASWSSQAAPLDIGAETARYVGARQVDVQGHPALLLPRLAGRPTSVVVWAPSAGELVSVSGTVVSDDDVVATARALAVPSLQPASLPAGFDQASGDGKDTAQPAPVPRRYTVSYGAAGSGNPATAVSTGRGPSLSITSQWQQSRPASAPDAGTVRGHPAFAARPPGSTDSTVTLIWQERDDLQLQVVASGIGEDDVRRVAEGLRERSADEVLAQTAPATLASVDAAGHSYQLSGSAQGSGRCFVFAVDGRAQATPTCGFDPRADGVSILLQTHPPPTPPTPPTLVGLVRADAAEVRVLFPDGSGASSPVTPPTGGGDTALYAVTLPAVRAVASVVALDRAGRELGRHTVLGEPVGAAAPPWSAPSLAASAVAPALVTAWRSDSRGAGCAALAFTSTGAGAGASPRIADFGVDGWGVAFDKPGLPGTDADGRPSADSGRSAYGVAGTGVDIVVALTDGWPAHRVWSDGSRADYGPEAGTGTKWLAELYVRGQRCLYNVWSSLGQGHLEELLDGLRFVTGNP